LLEPAGVMGITPAGCFTCFLERHNKALNLCQGCRDFHWAGVFDDGLIWSAIMPEVITPKAARIPTSVRVSFKSESSVSEDSDVSQFVTVALFSGIGLLISLVVVICGFEIAWL
jgi:hypothetical protein